MSYVQVRPDDQAAVRALAELNAVVAAADDPGQPVADAELTATALRYGWDLEPDTVYLYVPDGASDPVGSVAVGTSERDNLHLAWGGVAVLPEHRRRGHGSAMMAELTRIARDLGRTTLAVGVPADDEAAKGFLVRRGFTYASHEARRKQVLADVDADDLAARYASAREAARDYEVVRIMAPVDDELLGELLEVTNAINDAPRGELKMDDHVFDLQRLRDFQTAATGKRERMYRVLARHRHTGAIGGHTVMMVQPRHPGYAWQYDTAVHREHRGHRLGLLLKIDMMNWLAEAEPEIEVIETWNHADNTFMIDVNEAIGYRLDRVFDEYQTDLG